MGNHDFDAPNRLVRYLRQSGVTTLRNQVTTLSIDGQPLELAGLDFLFQRFDRDVLYQRIVSSWGPRQAVPRILLNHDPRAFVTLPARCADLVLSGHTHGGHAGIQLGKDRALSVIGLLGIPDQGLYRHADMQMFVTRCVWVLRLSYAAGDSAGDFDFEAAFGAEDVTESHLSVDRSGQASYIGLKEGEYDLAVSGRHWGNVYGCCCA